MTRQPSASHAALPARDGTSAHNETHNKPPGDQEGETAEDAMPSVLDRPSARLRNWLIVGNLVVWVLIILAIKWLIF
jgi:hypothetical protein